MSRTKAKAPAGRVTLDEAAEITGVSKASVQRRTASGDVRSRREPRVVTIALGDVKLIKPREPADADRRAVMLRPDLERYVVWERAAGDKPVSTWLAEFADAAARGTCDRRGALKRAC